MEEQAASAPSFAASLKRRLFSRTALIALAVSLAAGWAGAMIARRVYLDPLQATAETRFRSHMSLMRLYDLQVAFRSARGTYANDLDTLLGSSPDGAKLRDQLKADIDINTLAVIGDANRFRLEANVLDAERTAVKIRGPFGER